MSENAQARKTAEIAPVSNAWRAALPRDPEQATNAYFEGGYWLQVGGFCATLAATWLILASGVLAAWRDALERRVRHRWLSNALVIAAYLLLNTLLLAPFDVYRGFYREHLYGLASQSIGPWLTELLVVTVVTLVLGTLSISNSFFTITRHRESGF